VLDALAEARIEEAMREGAFDDLPGAGRPLVLDDDRLVPDHLRAAYRILRNAGFVPPEVEVRRERARLTTLIATLEDDAARRRALVKLALVEARLEANGLTLRVERGYERTLVERFGR
jgi:DnaJ-like protein